MTLCKGNDWFVDTGQVRSKYITPCFKSKAFMRECVSGMRQLVCCLGQDNLVPHLLMYSDGAIPKKSLKTVLKCAGLS